MDGGRNGVPQNDDGRHGPYRRRLRSREERRRVTALADSWKVTYPVAKIQGIPAYVVNGKYLIMTKSIRNFDGMVALVKELAAK